MSQSFISEKMGEDPVSSIIRKFCLMSDINPFLMAGLVWGAK